MLALNNCSFLLSNCPQFPPRISWKDIIHGILMFVKAEHEGEGSAIILG